MKRFGRLLVVAFLCQAALATAMDNASGGRVQQAVAILGDTVISKERLYQEMYKAGGKQTLDRLIGLHLMEEELQRRGITISPAEIDAAYERAIAVFRRQVGNRDMGEVLRSRFGLSVTQYKENVIKLDLALKKLITNEMQINDADVAGFYFTHKDQYREPERVKVRHIVVDPRAGLGKTAQEAGVLSQSHWRKAQKEALAIKRRLQDGADFATLAKEHSDDPRTRDRGGEIGWVAKGFLNAILESTCFSLKENEISDPIKTIMGYHLIQRIGYEKEKALSYVKIKDRVRKDYLDKLKRSSGDALIQRLKRDAIKSGRLKLFTPR
ncbi:MAG: peptidylprolyl isomerase [Planctomycetota bacterium]